MSWLKKIPWLSLSLILLTYAAFGWFLAESIPELIVWLMERADSYGWVLSESFLSRSILGLGIAFVLVIDLAFAAPNKLIAILFTSWLKSDIKAFFSVMLYCFVGVLIFCYFENFARFLVLLSADALARLEIQTAGCRNEWQAFVILAALGLTGVGIGLFTFALWGNLL